MIYSVKGVLIYKEALFAVVECGGVGFKCYTTMNTQRTLPAIGAEVTLYTHLHIKEDAMDLFGFSSHSELNCFKMLTGVSGVGPKVAISILSALAPEQVALAVASGDYKTLTRASGVGGKLAQRIALELRDKVNKMASPAEGLSAGTGTAGIPSAAGNAAEALNALSVLGYAPADVAGIVAKLDSALPVEELIRLTLKAMANRF